jgi:hypothetical protein
VIHKSPDAPTILPQDGSFLVFVNDARVARRTTRVSKFAPAGRREMNMGAVCFFLDAGAASAGPMPCR